MITKPESIAIPSQKFLLNSIVQTARDAEKRVVIDFGKLEKLLLSSQNKEVKTAEHMINQQKKIVKKLTVILNMKKMAWTM